MLARGSSDAGFRLRRSKSTSTVQWHPPPVPEPLDPEVAQRDALVAATTAFARSRKHGATEPNTKHNSDMQRSRSSASRKSLTSQGSHFPPREPRFRATNPPRNSQVGCVQRLSQPPTTNTEKFPPFYPTPCSDRLTSAHNSVIFGENQRPSAQSKPHRQTANSSVMSQQIRKARSMYYASSVQTGSPISRPPVKYLTTPPPEDVNLMPPIAPQLLQPRSLAPSPLASPQLPVTVEPGETVDTARDKYLQSFQQRQVKHKPSLFLAPFKKRQDRKKKERPASAGIASVASSNQPPLADGRIESLDDFGMPKLQKKQKRSFSNSLKDKFKKVFRRTSNQIPTLPVQQIDASRDYFNYQPSQAEDPAMRNMSINVPSPDDQTLLRARSHTPIPERAPSPFARPGSRGSNRSRASTRSLHSENNATYPSSRVTSWSDSSAGNTVAHRDVKRLTIIHEAKDSIGSDRDRSSSKSPVRRKVLPIPSLAAFRDPMPMEILLEEGATSIDPKRVFSALIREIESPKATKAVAHDVDGSPSSASDVFESSATKERRTSGAHELHAGTSADIHNSTKSDQRPPSRKRPITANSKTSSIKSFGRALKSTIRTVTPPDSKYLSGSDPPTSIRGPVRIPRGDAILLGDSSPQSEGEKDDAALGSIDFGMHSQSQPGTGDLHAPTVDKPSTEVIEQRVAKSNNRWRSALDTSQIPIFDRPYNRTLAGADFLTSTPGPTKICPWTPHMGGENSNHGLKETPDATPKSPRPKAVFSPLSPSIYSRNTDGISILPNDSMISLEGMHDANTPHEGGSAVIITTHAVKSYTIGTPSRRQEPESNTSSRDWKAWLSHEVSELDTDPASDYTITDTYTPTLRRISSPTRHHREKTQIEEDDYATITLDVKPDTDMHLQQLDAKSGNVPSLSKPGDFSATRGNNPPTTTPAHASSSNSPVAAQTTPSPPLPAPNIIARKQRPSLSSSLSHQSSSSTSSNGTPKSALMNDRFPFITSKRSTSSHSTQIQKSSRMATAQGSGSSSLVSKNTPSPKVYSDFSVPGTGRISKYEPNTGSKRIEERVHDLNDNARCINKENATPPTQIRRPEPARHNTADSLPTSITRPKSMLPLSSAALNKSPSALSQYTTNNQDGTLKARQGEAVSAEPSPTRKRLTVRARPISPSKFAARPRSAFDLRGANAVLNTKPASITSLTERNSELPHGVTGMILQQYQMSNASRTSTTSVRPHDEAVRSGIGSPCGLSPSQQSSCELFDSAKKPKVRVIHSSSTLALNKEPSPGLEERIIDSILVDEKTSSMRSGNEGGRTTPGQRMAERFLRERSAPRGSGPGSPVSVLERVENGSPRLKREDTPAFL